MAEDRICVLFCGCVNPADVNSSKKVDELDLCLSPHRIPVLDDQDVDFIATGPASQHALFVCADGKCWGIGKNSSSQLGIQNVDVLTPRLIDTVDVKIVHAAVGRHHSLFVTETGKVLSCGKNDSGQLGRAGKGNKPQVINALESVKVTKVACGGEFSLALSDEGDVWSWGSPEYGQIGHGSEFVSIGAGKTSFAPQKPKKVQGGLKGVKVTKVACGTNHCVALSEEGDVYTWGFGGYGRLGHKQQKDEFVPRKIEQKNFGPVTDIAAGSIFNLALGAHGVLYVWGKPKQTGDSYMYPSVVMDLSGWEIKNMTCGFQSLGVIGDEKTIMWGNGNMGQLGFGKAQKSSAMAKIVEALDDIKVVSINAGYSATFFRAVKFSDDTTDEKQKLSNKNLMSLPIYPTGGENEDPEEAEAEKKEKDGETCGVCGKSTVGNCGTVLICDGCEGEYHMKCAKPALKSVPKGDWYCANCGKAKKPAKKKRRTSK